MVFLPSHPCRQFLWIPMFGLFWSRLQNVLNELVGLCTASETRSDANVFGVPNTKSTRICSPFPRLFPLCCGSHFPEQCFKCCRSLTVASSKGFSSPACLPMSWQSSRLQMTRCCIFCRNKGKQKDKNSSSHSCVEAVSSQDGWTAKESSKTLWENEGNLTIAFVCSSCFLVCFCATDKKKSSHLDGDGTVNISRIAKNALR